MEQAGHSWYETFPIESENRGSFRAKMVMKYTSMSSSSTPQGVVVGRGFPSQGPTPLVLPRQVHGTTIIRAQSGQILPERPECDGVLIDHPGLRAALRFADCVPVLLWGVGPLPWMLGLHSGFNGTVADIAGKGVAFLKSRFSSISLNEVHAWIGPGICPRCYPRRVNDPLIERLKKTYGRDCWYESTSGVHCDLGGIIFRQLIYAGISAQRIARARFCSCCDSEFCYSYRQGDMVPRMWLFFEIREATN